jgi:fucose 4-O-acetylase-like acetyltransferase
MAQRAYSIDRLRTVMTLIVLFAHTWMTYGADGTWFYREVPGSHSRFSLAGTLYCLTNQAYLMGLFFLIAGYFTPLSYDRKTMSRFLLDRFLRLGLPLLGFGLVLAPLTTAMVDAAFGQGFWPSIDSLWQKKEFVNGPMWFAEALLLMSVGYCLWQILGSKLRPANPSLTQLELSSLPGNRTWFVAAIGVAITAFVLRMWAPVDTRYFGMWIGYFPSYIFLFAVGICAWRFQWLTQLTWKQARTWLILAVLAWPIMPAAAIFFKLRGESPYFAGGMTVPSLLYATWEPFVAWGLIAAGLVWFHTQFNKPSAVHDWLSRRAYAVFVIHPPILVGVCLFLRPWVARAPIKFGVAGTLGCAAAWLVADPLVRLPGLRRIF